MTAATRRRRACAPCADCHTETLSAEGASNEYYMVRDEVWEAARMGRRGYLCIGCLEARLGRQLALWGEP